MQILAPGAAAPLSLLRNEYVPHALDRLGRGRVKAADQAVDLIELLGLSDKHNFRAQLFEPLAVRVKVALQGKYADSDHSLGSYQVATHQGSKQS